MDDNKTSRIRCHGCHNYGHFIIDCSDCYKCEICEKHHLNGRPCPTRIVFADSRTSPAAIVSTVTLHEGECQSTQEMHQPHDPLHSQRAGRSFSDENQVSSISNIAPAGIRSLRSSENSLKEMPTTHSNQERSMTQQHPYQVHQESRQVLVGGHVMHTVTRTITEVRRCVGISS